MAATKAAKATLEDGEAPVVVPCTNCGSPAQFTLGDPVNVINFCGSCLPEHFIPAASAGEFPLVTP